MKLGLFLLILGLILAGAGIAGWMYADPNLAFWGGGPFNVDEAQMANAAGCGLAVAGGGLAIGGIVRMMVKK